MLLLTTTSDLLQLVTGSAVSTDIVASFVDITTSTFTPGSSEANVSTATTTTIVAAPAASTQRQIKAISVTNKSSSTAQTVTLQKSSSSMAYNVTGAITLQPGEVLYYQDGIGFSVRDINGQIKETNTTLLTSGYVGYGSSAGLLTGSSNFTYSSNTLTVGSATSQNAAFQGVFGSGGAYAGVVLVTGSTGTGFFGMNNANNANIPVQFGYNFNTNTLSIVSNSATVMTIGSTGDVNIAAPTGTVNQGTVTLTATGNQGNWAGSFIGNSTTNHSYGMYVAAGTSSSDTAFGVYSQAYGQYLLVNGAGNTTLGPPLSGNQTLTVQGTTGTNVPALIINSPAAASTSQTPLVVYRTVGTTANSIGAGAGIALTDSGASPNTGTEIQHSGGQTEFWQYNGSWNQIMYFNTNRNVIINAPSSGVALAVSGSIFSSNSISAGGNGSVTTGIQSTLIGETTSSGSYNVGLGINGYFDGSNWRTGTDGGSNAASFILTPHGGGGLNFYVIAATGGTNQTISNTSLASYNGLSISTSRVITFPGYGAGTLSTNSSGVISASDGRYKTKTREVTNGIETIEKLKPTYFRWNDDHEFATEHEELGFIAQEVSAVIPEASPEPETNDKVKNYHDRAIIAMLVKAVQEQQAQIETQQEHIEAQQEQINTLLAQVAALLSK